MDTAVLTSASVALSDVTMQPSQTTHSPRPSFLDLPAELRLLVYGRVIGSVSIPTSRHMADYRGFLLSCLRILTEFEVEAVKPINKLLEQARNEWTDHPLPLRVPTLVHLSDTLNPQVGIPTTTINSHGDSALPQLLRLLLDHGPPSFVLYPCSDTKGSYERYYNACWVMRRQFHRVLKERKVSVKDHQFYAGRRITVFNCGCTLIHDNGCLMYYTAKGVAAGKQIEWEDNPMRKAYGEIN
jgi:hypothetical protein